MKSGSVRVGIIGAAGVVGQQLITGLEERGFPTGELRLMATEHSAGTSVLFAGRELTITETTGERLSDLDLVFLAAGTSASRQWAPIAVSKGAVVIDKSSTFRSDPDVPLVVPEVNPEDTFRHHGIIASPNCSTIQLVMALKPLLDAVGLERVTVSTYQSVSGTGRDAMDELHSQSGDVLQGRSIAPSVYPKQIAFNLLPHIDGFDAAGYTREEMKLVNETRRILGLPELRISATAVRVPVFVGHSESVLVETCDAASPEQVRNWLDSFPGVVVCDEPENGRYPTPVEAAGDDHVYVGRIRRDLGSERGIWLWVVADNLRKGAATNALHIAEQLFGGGRSDGRC